MALLHNDPERRSTVSLCTKRKSIGQDEEETRSHSDEHSQGQSDGADEPDDATHSQGQSEVADEPDDASLHSANKRTKADASSPHDEDANMPDVTETDAPAIAATSSQHTTPRRMLRTRMPASSSSVKAKSGRLGGRVCQIFTCIVCSLSCSAASTPATVRKRPHSRSRPANESSDQDDNRPLKAQITGFSQEMVKVYKEKKIRRKPFTDEDWIGWDHSCAFLLDCSSGSCGACFVASGQCTK